MFTLIISEWYSKRKFEKCVGNFWNITEKSNLYFENWKGNGVKDMFLLPARNKSWCQLMVDEGKFINTELSQLINEQGVLELENHSLVTLSEIMLPRSSLVENVIKTNLHYVSPWGKATSPSTKYPWLQSEA